MLREKIRKFVGKVATVNYIPLPTGTGFNKKDVVEIEQIDDKTLIIKKLA